ncbi:39040_t:CDS:2 [Gigaspora margarita]|uniref:39040_t:CDS:1 n=1 Tax=Gigaspora margarita TaxID=4874 RepID=A0ABM8VY53_GIGMA|nr:39040_t:CDS:2 [Gigaspora margarita]
MAISKNNKWAPKAYPVARLSRINKPYSNCTLVNELYTNNIFNEEKIPDTIKISNANYKIDLDDNMTSFKIN